MSETVKIIHAADLHLGAEFSFLDDAKKQLRKSELRLSFEKIIGICRDNKIDLLLLAGDVFDTNAVSEQEISAFFSGVEKIPETRVIAVFGNHDPLMQDSPFLNHALPENLHLIAKESESVSFDDINCTVYGSSFTSCYKPEPQRPFPASVDESRINIAVIHGDTAQGSNYNYVSREFLANSKMDYVALGHIHTHTDVQKVANTYYAYSGCPEPHGFDECGEMGIIAGSISKAESKFQFLPISRRRFETVTVDVSEDINSEQIACRIENTLKLLFGDNFGENLYKAVLVGELPETVKPNKSEIISRLENKVFFLKIKDETELRTDLQLLALEKSLKGEFVRVMLESMENEPERKGELAEALKIGLKAFSREVKFDEDK